MDEEQRPSFRKPAHDPSHRNYRRRSPIVSKSSSSPPRRGGKRVRSISPSPVREVGNAGRRDQVKVRSNGSERGAFRDRSFRNGREHSPISERPVQPQHHTHHHGRNHKVDHSDSHGDSNAYSGARHDHFRRELDSDRSDWDDRPREDRDHREKDVERGRDKGKALCKDDDRSWGRERGGVRDGSKGNMEGNMGRIGNSTRVRSTEWDRERDRDSRGERDRDRDQAQMQGSDGGELRYKEEKELHGRRHREYIRDNDVHKVRENGKGDRFSEEEDARVVDLQKGRDKYKDQGGQRGRNKDFPSQREERNGRYVFQEVGKQKHMSGSDDKETERSSGEGGHHLNARQGDRGVNQDGGEKDSGRDKSKRYRGRDERERGTTGWDQVPVPSMPGSPGESSKEKTAPSSVGHNGLGTDGRSEVGNHSNVSGELPLQGKADSEGIVDSDLNTGGQQPEVLDSVLNSGEGHGNKPATVAGGKPAKSSKWGPSPSEDAMSTEVANDFNAAKLAAIRAAELVNKNLSLAGFMSADHKKKLLWGSKKATTVEQEPVVAAAGTNRWDTVHFSDRDRREKFHKLMGVKGDLKDGEAPPPPIGTAIFTEEKQRELQNDLEKQFTQGLRRRDGRTVGLGL